MSNIYIGVRTGEGTLVEQTILLAEIHTEIELVLAVAQSLTSADIRGLDQLQVCFYDTDESLIYETALQDGQKMRSHAERLNNGWIEEMRQFAEFVALCAVHFSKLQLFTTA